MNTAPTSNGLHTPPVPRRVEVHEQHNNAGYGRLVIMIHDGLQWTVLGVDLKTALGFVVTVALGVDVPMSHVVADAFGQAAKMLPRDVSAMLRSMMDHPLRP